MEEGLEEPLFLFGDGLARHAGFKLGPAHALMGQQEIGHGQQLFAVGGQNAGTLGIGPVDRRLDLFVNDAGRLV